MTLNKKTYWVIDIETMVNCFILCGEDAHSDRKFHFILWKYKNDLSNLYKFLNYCKKSGDIHVTFNGLAFDSQVLQWLIENETEEFLRLDTDAIINMIYNKAQECIKKSNLNEWQEFPEWKLNITQIDIFKQNHWDNPAKLCSLKWLQCSMDWPSIEDMPYSHTHYVENEKQLGEILNYCYNDVAATKKGFLLCKEGTELREELSKEYGLNLNSASEPRLSKELFLHFLSLKTGRDKKELKSYTTLREKIEVKDILLPYIHFERQEFVMLLNNFKQLVINGTELRGAFKYKVKYRGIEIDYGVGGIHGFSKEGIYSNDTDYLIMTSDVKSYYPNLAIKNKWAPAHIDKKAFCEQYEQFYIDRGNFKKGTAKNYLYKILLNATFGLSIDKHSFLSDPQLGVTITINGQLLLSMLLEMICEGIPEAQPLLLNTDGLEVRIPRQKEAKYLEICKEWEKRTLLELEHDKYAKIVAYDCNNYISLYENGKSKCKGRFEYEAHDKYDTNVLHKNKSFLVVAKGIYEYFINGVAPEHYVKNHRSIYDFCGYARAKGKWKFYQISSTQEGIIEKPIQKTLRYFMSTTGSKVVKREQETNREIQVVAGRYHLVEFNRFQEKKWEDYNIDYQFYIKEIQKEIQFIEKPQLTLF
jgi:hypothetical protein